MANTNRKLIDLSGQQFERWTVVNEGQRRYRPSRTRGVRTWNCVCECGTTANIEQPSLTSGNSRSCGCLERELTIQRNYKHGCAKRKAVIPEYDIWCGIIKRTENPNAVSYPNYGGRGIKMSPQWRNSFEQFYADMGKRPTPEHELERRNNNGPYAKDNCRWATHTEQAHNKRNNRWITFNGETLCWSDWGRRLGTSAGTIQGRIKLGWSVEQAVTTPVGRRRSG
jgi:hypothetical protein